MSAEQNSGIISPVAPEGMTRSGDGYNFTEGNQLWKLRLRHGLKKQKFTDPHELIEAVCGYFNWVEENPLHEAKAFSYEGDVTVEDLPKMRAATVTGLCMYIGICTSTWREWRNPKEPTKYREDLIEVIRFAEDYIREQKFTGAAAGLLNPAIIMRDLGLVDKQQLQGPGGGPLQSITADMDPQTAAEAYKAMLDAESAEDSQS